MSYIIAIILGMLIVFNWGPIKSYMDQKIETSTQQESSASEEDRTADSQKESSTDKKSKNINKEEKNSDSFAEFK